MYSEMILKLPFFPISLQKVIYEMDEGMNFHYVTAMFWVKYNCICSFGIPINISLKL